MRWLIILSLTLYLVSLALHVRSRKSIALVVLFLAGFANIADVTWEWIQAGQAPLSSMQQVMVALGACAAPAYMIIVWGRGLHWMSAVFPLAGAIPLLLSLVFERKAAWHLAPALQSPWFVPHVMAYMVSYSLAMIAFLLASTGPLFRQEQEHRARFERGSYEVLCVAFPLLTFGMISGALWADGVWGGYWSWDPKETWALITWTLYLIYFHCRSRPALRRYAGWAHTLAFLALLTTFFLVNLLPKLSSKLHSYV